jgi:Antitoxin-like ribbon-helix-helix
MSRSTQRRAALPAIPITTPTGVFGGQAEKATHTANRARSTGPRQGKKAAPFWMPEAAKRQLDLLRIEQDTTIQALLTEALNDLFRKYDKPPIA